MKYLQLFILFTITLTITSSCEKNDAVIPQLTSVNVVHAVINASAIKVNTTGSNITYTSYTDSIRFGAFKLYSLVASDATPLSIVASSDTTKPLFNAELFTSAGEMYSLYLTGQYPQADTVWVREEMSNYTDSLIGIRFVNLSPNSNAIKVNIKGNATQLEANNLGYKQITAFKQYAAKTTNPNYQFEVRDAATSTLLTSFTLSYTRFHNHTLVIKGLTGVTGTNAISVFSVAPY
ncbi:DUF4397 domain-containing protein [Niastella caeni]|uniref:DUF4397 domain-containing protein n=1 Tax=Niastella caeni TaxID=2569763 RepID=A0A4S8HSG3_9BACT|nr:DUF4397 domain-containing protein [Niastella caeni]THU38390.1 DUF4397 domain-containing protein [Niastella caeni]